ncbi:MAG: hypothetical protein LUE17_13090 [Planctomycetaceae bacterium]|nr:hypothetical protein [Planctomycetaceae bacterium]
MRHDKLLILLLAAGLLWLPPPCRAASGDGCTRLPEDISPTGGGQAQTTVRLRMPTIAARAGPEIPKTLVDLRRSAGDRYLCVERGNFLVAGDLDLPDYEYLVDGVLDYCAKALVSVYFDKGPVLDKTVNIFVFRDYTSYENGLRRFVGMDPISPYGHYGHAQKYIVVNYETGPGTMAHELTHAMMSEDFPQAQIWLGEGMASLYEHCWAQGNVLRGDDNWRLPELQDALRRDALTPLSTLLAMTPSEFRTVNESLNYAQARYFCKYLEDLGLLPDIYRSFRDGQHLDPTGARFVVRALGKPLDVVEQAWKRWITYQYWKE